ncbi:MAG TPA: DUF4294 domain-containing protein [Candidatus Avirikenella pullistercoris]|nr:DUF4294 domain-containing protein [Candidatus Avirikenella pullistercoris]
MKPISILCILLLSFFAGEGYSQAKNNKTQYYVEIIYGDTIQAIRLKDLPIISKKKRNGMSNARYQRLIRAVKLTYPIAQEANRKLKEMERHLLTLKTKQQQQQYIKNVEEELKKEYTPILKQMSMYQGMVLLKLIDRETGQTSYSLIQELRGKFSAFFWQGIARLFGGNLKIEYDKEGDDAIIEQLILLYEDGLL